MGQAAAHRRPQRLADWRSAVAARAARAEEAGARHRDPLGRHVLLWHKGGAGGVSARPDQGGPRRSHPGVPCARQSRLLRRRRGGLLPRARRVWRAAGLLLHAARRRRADRRGGHGAAQQPGLLADDDALPARRPDRLGAAPDRGRQAGRAQDHLHEPPPVLLARRERRRRQQRLWRGAGRRLDCHGPPPLTPAPVCRRGAHGARPDPGPAQRVPDERVQHRLHGARRRAEQRPAASGKHAAAEPVPSRRPRVRLRLLLGPRALDVHL
uniref:Uncharacterized protein n=1 Tax=Emiliania huxleyi (strain CCMP1516) TaxID=280463 RepID=A0A0D3J7Y9_EMIH1